MQSLAPGSMLRRMHGSPVRPRCDRAESSDARPNPNRRGFDFARIARADRRDFSTLARRPPRQRCTDASTGPVDGERRFAGRIGQLPCAGPSPRWRHRLLHRVFGESPKGSRDRDVAARAQAPKTDRRGAGAGLELRDDGAIGQSLRASPLRSDQATGRPICCVPTRCEQAIKRQMGGSVPLSVDRWSTRRLRHRARGERRGRWRTVACARGWASAGPGACSALLEAPQRTFAAPRDQGLQIRWVSVERH